MPKPSQTSKPIEFKIPHPQTLEEVIENFNWLPRVFGFTQVQELVFKLYGKMKLLKSDTEFKQFCIKHQALTIDGKVTTGKALNGQRIPFAYPLFCDIWNVIKNREDKKEYAEEKSWDSLINIEIPF